MNDLDIKVSSPTSIAATQDIATVLKGLDTSVEGLDEKTSANRLVEYGLNSIAHEARHGLVWIFFQRAKNPLILLLLALAIISVFIGDPRAAIVMLAMILVGVCLGAFQEFRSSRAEAALAAMVSTLATVNRRSTEKPELSKSERRDIPQNQLVPGDIVTLSAGDLIPADVRLILAKNLSVNQAPLTGESLPVDKDAQLSTGTTPPFDLHNICYMGTSVLSGTGTAVVISTGKRTYFGSLANSILGQRAVTDFERGLEKFTWLMIRFILVMVPIVFLLNGFLKGNWFEALLFSVSVAVGLTPEMLPMIVTVNLAKGALKLSRSQVIVKRLNAIQNLGGMDILCADKTGTLTQDKVILEKHLNLLGEETAEVLSFAYLNSFHQTGLKNLLDVAVLKRGDLEHIRAIEAKYEKVDEIPFDFARKRMSVVVRDKLTGKHILICKGAVETVYETSHFVEVLKTITPIDESHRRTMDELTTKLNEDGFRAVAVAYKEMAEVKTEYSASDEEGLTLVGYLAFLDPPKESACEAIIALRNAGVEVKILTGDNSVITQKICRDVGLLVSHVLLGPEISKMTDSELAVAAESATIFARLTPDQKARIIQALQAKKHVVGFLGDGINDGPALRTADVGLSVDSAVDVAKESADIILLQKNLLILREGVIEGRKVFANIVKYIRMAASSNFGNMLSVLGASAFLPFLPMQPIQVLANNFLYDISQTTIPTDHVDSEYLKKPQHWKVTEIRKFILLIGPISSIFDYTTFFVMLHFFHAWNNAPLFQTGWFVESLATQTLIIHVIRTNKIPFLQSRPSLPVVVTSLAIIALAVWLPFSPFTNALMLTALPAGYWIALSITMVSYFILTQLVKSALLRRYGYG